MRLVLMFAGLCVSPTVLRAQPAVAPGDGVSELLNEIERVIAEHVPDRYVDFVYPTSDQARAQEFASTLEPAATRVVVRERDRRPLPGPAGEGYRLLVEVFTEAGARARLQTWRLDLRRMPGTMTGADSAAIPQWRILTQEVLTSLDGLHRLALNPTKQYAARNLTVLSEDLQLTLSGGSVFVAETQEGVTGLVLLGRGEMSFKPSVATERGQLKIFCGAETLQARFDVAFVRLNPQEFADRVSRSALTETAVDPRALRRAQSVFRDEIGKSFTLAMNDLSKDDWSLQPPLGDFLAEVRTRKYSTLTYARSSSESEDITLFDRIHQRNISVYASQQKLASRGRFYSEDDRTDFDVLDYYVEANFFPDRDWMQGRTRMRIRVRSYMTATLTMKLAETLTVQSMFSEELGRLLSLRVRGQNSIVVSLPTTVSQGRELTLTVAYAGRLLAQPADREATGQIRREERQMPGAISLITLEPSFLYSSRSYWYPQSGTTDYATATLRIAVPEGYACVASGELVPGSPVTVGSKAHGDQDASKVYVFQAKRPLRYLAAIVSRFVRVTSTVLSLTTHPIRGEPSPGGGPQEPKLKSDAGEPIQSIQVAVEANPRQVSNGLGLSARAGDVLQYYSSVLGDCPYSSFTLALVENDLPGGHSPAYFAALNQPLPSSGLTWRNDPAAFANYPEFFLAHEAAHQWWGQAVGWKNFHEQWLSEGFAQYFAALYAQHHRGNALFGDIIRQFRRWALERSDQGPVYLGYRLGHVRNDGRIFRALVYNKGAAVLHMLRRLVGDTVFFEALRSFYREWRYQKAGTDDLRKTFEARSNRSLERFFERWIYETRIPEIRYSYSIEGSEAVVRFEQLGDVFDLPVTVTLNYVDRPLADVVVALTEQVVEARVPLAGTLKSIDVNRDDAALAVFVRRR